MAPPSTFQWPRAILRSHFQKRIRQFYADGLITEQGLWMFLMKHQKAGYLKTYIKNNSISSPDAKEVAKLFFEVQEPMTKRPGVQYNVADIPIRTEDLVTWNCMTAGNSAKVGNKVSIQTYEDVVLCQNNRAIVDPRSGLSAQIGTVNIDLKTKEGLPNQAYYILGDLILDFEPPKGSREPTLPKILKGSLRDLFKLEMGFKLKIETYLANPGDLEFIPTDKKRAAHFVKQKQEFGVRFLAYELLKYNPHNGFVKFKLNFRGDDFASNRMLDRKKDAGGVTRTQKNRETNFFSALMETIANCGGLWGYKIDVDDVDITDIQQITAGSAALAVGDITRDALKDEKKKKDEAARKKKNKKLVKHGEDPIKPKTETPTEVVEGYFTTIESILVAGLMLYLDVPSNPLKSAATKKKLSPVTEWAKFRLALQHSVPITLYKNPDTVYADARKLQKELRLGAPKVLDAINYIAHGLRHLPEYEFGRILETPVDSKVLRNFLLNMYRRSEMNTLRSFIELVLRDLLPSCVTMSFTAKSSSDTSFSSFFGVNKAVLAGGGVLPYDNIDPGLLGYVAKTQYLGRSHGEQQRPRFTHRRISYENFFGMVDAPKTALGLNISYYSATDRVSAIVTHTKVTRETVIKDTVKNLLKFRVFPLYVSGAGHTSFVKDSYRTVTIPASLPLKLIVLDNKDAAESRRQQAQDHSVDLIHRRFYKMNLTFNDIITLKPYMHRFYVPPSVFGFSSHKEEEFGFAGIYVASNVKYTITKPLQGIKCSVTAIYELAGIQSLINPAVLKEVHRLEKQKKEDEKVPAVPPPYKAPTNEEALVSTQESHDGME